MPETTPERQRSKLDGAWRSSAATDLATPYAEPKFLLYCGVDGEYTLAKEGEEWRLRFVSMHDALACARGMTEVAVPITLYGALGQEVLESMVRPLPALEKIDAAAIGASTKGTPDTR